jgi:hypothetical protein
LTGADFPAVIARGRTSGPGGWPGLQNRWGAWKHVPGRFDSSVLPTLSPSDNGRLWLLNHRTPAPALTLNTASIPPMRDAHVDVPKHNLNRLAPTWSEQRQILVDAVRQLDGKVSALATNPQGAVFESTIKSNGTLGGALT